MLSPCPYGLEPVDFMLRLTGGAPYVLELKNKISFVCLDDGEKKLNTIFFNIPIEPQQWLENRKKYLSQSAFMNILLQHTPHCIPYGKHKNNTCKSQIYKHLRVLGRSSFDVANGNTNIIVVIITVAVTFSILTSSFTCGLNGGKDKTHKTTSGERLGDWLKTKVKKR